MQAICCDAIQSCVIQNHHAIRTARQSPQSEQGVVRLHHNVANLVLIGEHTVGLHQFLGEMVGEALHYVGAHARASSTGNWVAEHETF